MKKILAFLIISVFVQVVQAQHYQGLTTDNYSGINRLYVNPAFAVDTCNKFSINLFGVSTVFNNDYIRINGENSFSDNQTYSNIGADMKIITPGFMYTINKKHAIGLTSDFNLGTNGFFNADLIDVLDRDPLEFNNSNGHLGFKTWQSIGLSYAYTPINTGNHKFTIGAAGKLLMGAVSSQLDVVDINSEVGTDGMVDLSGSVTYTVPDFVNNIIDNEINDGDAGYVEKNEDFEFSNYGFGLDLGAVYEWKQNESDDGYKLRVDVAVNDIGHIEMKGNTTVTYDLSTRVDESTWNQWDIVDMINNISEDNVDTISNISSKMYMNTTLRLGLDYRISSKFYANIDFRTSIQDKYLDDIDSNSKTQFLFTPRYESRHISAYMPIGVDGYGDFAWGAGVRLGCFFIGSNNALSYLVGASDYSISGYVGVSIPIAGKYRK